MFKNGRHAARGGGPRAAGGVQRAAAAPPEHRRRRPRACTPVCPASSSMARTFSDMKSTPSTQTAAQPASAMRTAASAMTSESEM